MSTLQCGSKKIHIDAEGFLSQSEKWDESVATVLAQKIIALDTNSKNSNYSQI